MDGLRTVKLAPEGDLWAAGIPGSPVPFGRGVDPAEALARYTNNRRKYLEAQERPLYPSWMREPSWRPSL